jgi:hypothetical protein
MKENSGLVFVVDKILHMSNSSPSNVSRILTCPSRTNVPSTCLSARVLTSCGSPVSGCLIVSGMEPESAHFFEKLGARSGQVLRKILLAACITTVVCLSQETRGCQSPIRQLSRLASMCDRRNQVLDYCNTPRYIKSRSARIDEGKRYKTRAVTLWSEAQNQSSCQNWR